MSRRDPKSVSYLTVLAGSWFALALLIILVLGLVLIAALTLWGTWLEENWHLTFHNPFPWVRLPILNWNVPLYWILFGLIALLVLLLYFLKLKRRALHVPSTFLWRKSIEDLHVNSLFQWLRRNVLLILQLMILLGLGYALAAPTYNTEASGRHIIIMIDNSASMSATDEKPTRLEVAKREALLRIDALDESDQAMIIAFSSEAETLQSYTNRKEALRRAVERIQPSHRPTQLRERNRNGFEEALRLAEGQANPRRSAEDAGVPQPDPGEAIPRAVVRPEGVTTDVYVYSDGRVPDLPNFSLGRLNLHLQSIGHSSNNVGIDQLDLRRDDKQPDHYEVSVRVLNFRDQPVEAKIELLVFADEQDRQVLPIKLSGRTVQETKQTDGQTLREVLPGKSAPQLTTFSIKDPGTGHVQARLRDANGQLWGDDFTLDDSGWLAIAPARKARVLRVGERNEILDAFLKAAQSRGRAVVTELSPAGFAENATYKQATLIDMFDLVLFDRCAPPRREELPLANTFFVGAAPPYAGWDAMMSNLSVKEYRHAHPLFKGIETLQGLEIDAARALQRKDLPKRASALMETEQEPVLWALGRDRYTDLVMTFPLVIVDKEGRTVPNSNWLTQPPGTLPLFLGNVLNELGRYREYEGSIRPGVPKTLEYGGADEVEVVDPRKEKHKLKREQGKELIFAATNQVGVYEVFWGEEGQHRFAVNLFDQQESQIQPREDVQIGSETTKKQEPLQQRRELWPWFVLAALGILLLEWCLYNWRIYV